MTVTNLVPSLVQQATAIESVHPRGIVISSLPRVDPVVDVVSIAASANCRTSPPPPVTTPSTIRRETRAMTA